MARNDFQKLFKKQLQDALLTDEMKQRMAKTSAQKGAEQADMPAEPEKTPKKAAAKKKTAPAKAASDKSKIKKPGAKAKPEAKAKTEVKAKAEAEAKAEAKQAADTKTPPEPVAEKAKVEAPAKAVAPAPAAPTAPAKPAEPKPEPPAQPPAPAKVAAPSPAQSRTGRTISAPAEPARPKPTAEAEKPQTQPKKAAAAPKKETKKQKPQNSDDMGQDFWEEDEDTLRDKYLTFSLGEESYGVEVRHILEILVIQPITEVPDMPDYVKGLINLRGQVIPVMDVRTRFRMESRDYHERTCVVVMRLEQTLVGLVVDSVQEVIIIPQADVGPPPALGALKSSQYIMGMGKVGEQVIILLDLERVLYAGKAGERLRNNLG